MTNIQDNGKEAILGRQKNEYLYSSHLIADDHYESKRENLNNLMLFFPFLSQMIAMFCM